MDGWMSGWMDGWMDPISAHLIISLINLSSFVCLSVQLSLSTIIIYLLTFPSQNYFHLQADIFPDKEHGGRTFRNQAVMSSLGLPQVKNTS